jgi:hypothetical protein
MTFAFKTVLALAAIASVSACLDTVDIDRGGGSSGQDRPYNQTINFDRGAGGSGVLTQTVQSGAGPSGSARICFINNGPVEATLLHGTPGINPMRAAPGGQSCANFASSLRVSFTLVETQGFLPLPAAPDRAFVYTLAPFDGDILQLAWQVR